MIRSAVLLQRILNTINAIMNIAPAMAEAEPDLSSARDWLTNMFGRLSLAAQSSPCQLSLEMRMINDMRPGLAASDSLRAFFDREIERLAAHTALLAIVLDAR